MMSATPIPARAKELRLNGKRRVLGSWGNFILTAGILLIVFLVFAPVLGQAFLGLDDGVHLLQNTAVRTMDVAHLKQIFTSTVTSVYVPLSILSYAIEYHFVGYQPFIYHLDNLLLHCAVVCCVLALGLRLKLSYPAATIAAFLFGIHPLHVEPVVWVTARKDVLYAVLYLLAVLCYLKYCEKIEENPRRAQWYGIDTVVFGVLSALAKPMALSLPLVLFLLDIFRGRRISRQAIEEKVVLGICLFPIIWKTYALNSGYPISALGKAVLIWLWSFTFYIRQLIFPLVVSPGYDLPQPITWTDPEYLFVLAITLAIVASWWVFRRNRWWLFAWGYYVASMFFLFRLDDVVSSQIVADRYFYLSSLGFFLFLGQAAGKVIFESTNVARRKIGIVALAVVALVLAGKSNAQVRLWADEEVLWNYTLQHAPRSFLAYNSRGNVFMAKGDLGRAITDFSTAITVWPQFAEAFHNRGIAYYRRGELEKALRDYNRALQLKSVKLPSAYTNRGLTFFHLGRMAEALADYQTALKLNPRDVNAYNNRGMLYFAQKKFVEAKEDFNRALELDGDFARAWANHGNVLLMEGKYLKALADYDRAIDLDPKYAGAYFNRSLVYRNMKNYAHALKDARTAAALGFKMDPSYLEQLRVAAEGMGQAILPAQ